MAIHHKLIATAARLYWRLRRPRTLGVRGLVLDGDNRIALVRHTYADHWYLPGGGVKKGESFEQALARELREEIALTDFAVERLLGIYHSRREYKDDHIAVFVARVPPGAKEPLARADYLEIEQAAWFDLEDLPPDLSPATARRIAEYRAAVVGGGSW